MHWLIKIWSGSILNIYILKRLNIEFDAYESESQYFENAKEWVVKMCELGLAHRLWVIELLFKIICESFELNSIFNQF
jgi:hypothetical protein